MRLVRKSDFFFELNEDQIAKYPLNKRDQSKLLCYQYGKITHHKFTDVSSILPKDSLLIMNNAKVIPARLYFKRKTGALIEVLLLEPVKPSSYEKSFASTQASQWKCMIGNSKKWKEGEFLDLSIQSGLIQAQLISKTHRIVELSWTNKKLFTEVLQKIGELPLPPYLNRKTEDSDIKTYQTVFAKNEGSVAAPTAGLHFTDDVLSNIVDKGVAISEVTLHVGAGTFLPVKEDDVINHEMHQEHFEVTIDTLNLLMNHDQRIAVGTTSLRVLESLYWIGIQLSQNDESFFVSKLEPYEKNSKLTFKESIGIIKSYMHTHNITVIEAATEILILPDCELKSITGLITNFHLPESTLLMLIASIVGEEWKDIYETAKAEKYRFLSYGDSSILFKNL
ncbi:MAG: S-adenosylmethionine:tRNA ribosyltransferase-isomerase [Bacteroidia bacterium]|nr:S-adenosylmethionine:tRNA ribosyltransferase-isomerase [Bacteroidia bacterium]MDG2042449.1 S-adenosylmethionine:tRNA ribosyltransferase-isomerase [Bacteroidia bacterium]